MEIEVQERFSKLPFPIHKVKLTPKQLFEQWPDLMRYFPRKEMPIWTGQNIVRIIKYIFFLYHPNSDLIDEYPDELQLRKDAAALEAGFTRKKGDTWPDDVKELMNFKEKATRNMILDFLKAAKSNVWREIVVTEEELDQLYTIRANEISSLKNKNLLQLCRERNDELKVLWRTFWADHRDLEKAAKKEILPISPENVFKEMEVPDYLKKILQVQDVPKAQRLHKVLTKEGALSGLDSPDTEG